MSKYSFIFKAGMSNYCHTRERGDIPGCTPAVDVFIERTLEEVRTIIATDGYQRVWDEYRNSSGSIGWNEWLNHPIHKRKPYSPFKAASTA